MTAKVSELSARSKVDEIELTVIEKGEIRDVSTRDGAGKVCDAKGQDVHGGIITVSLWNDEIDKVGVNQKVKITNGWVSEFRGTLQISAGRYGKLEVL